jgi:pilus assembly protein CpaE
MKNPSKSTTIKLLSLGADDILSLTPDEVELTGSLARTAAHRPDVHDRTMRSRFRTFVFLHASGGAGATTLAVNAALQLQKNAQKFGGKACLLDFDLQFGDVDLHLDLPRRSNLIDLVRSPDRLDRRMLDNLMIPGPNDLQVLTAPDQPVPLDALKKETAETIMSLARRHFRYVVVDMPISLTSWTDSILRRADYIFIVTQVNVVALRAARRLIDALRQEDLGDVPLVAIANRYPSKGPGRKISIPEAEKMLRVPISTQIVSDFGLVVNCLDQGVPAFIQQPSSKYARAVGDLFGNLEPQLATNGKKKKGLARFVNLGGSNV